MIPSTLFTIVLAALSTVCTVNGAIVQREGTFTLLTSSTGQTQGQTQSTTATQSTAPTTSATTRPTTTSSASTTPVTSSAPVTTSATTTQTTSSGTVVVPPTKTTATQSSATTSATPPATTATTTSPSPVITAGIANCDGVQQWQSAFAYSAGDRVIFNNQLFTAKQWTYNNAPPSHADQWTAGGVCSQPIRNQANCNGVAAWDKTVAYTGGSKVTFNGHLWSAVQWTESNSPGDLSGSWQDLGACA